jgi:hypothetical protein
MDEVYRDIYAQLYDSLGLGPEVFRQNWYYSEQRLTGFPLNAATIREMIDEAERESFGSTLAPAPPDRQRLRPDAKVFLLTNLLNMVAVPVGLSERARNLDLRRLLFADTSTLMKLAAAETKNREVSSHAVLQAVAKSWPKLNLSGLKLWED